MKSRWQIPVRALPLALQTPRLRSRHPARPVRGRPEHPEVGKGRLRDPQTAEGALSREDECVGRGEAEGKPDPLPRERALCLGAGDGSPACSGGVRGTAARSGCVARGGALLKGGAPFAQRSPWNSLRRTIRSTVRLTHRASHSSSSSSSSTLRRDATPATANGRARRRRACRSKCCGSGGCVCSAAC